MMPDFLENIAERLKTSAHVKTVYGEPITAEGKVIVPVAKVCYGFGGGGGAGEEQSGRKGEGGGGGGGVRATPVGLIEITSTATRFIEFGFVRKITVALLAGFLLGRLFHRCSR